MAIRNLLRMDQLEDFEEYLEREGYMILPPSKNPYEVLRAKKGGYTVIIYRRSDAKEHLSIAERDYKLVKKFLTEGKAQVDANIQEETAEELPWK